MICRSCGKDLNMHTAVIGEDNPFPGDLSVCFYCGVLSKFGDDLGLIPLQPEELVELNDHDPETFDQLMMIRTRILDSKPIDFNL